MPQEKVATLRLHLVFNSGDPCFKSPMRDILALTGAEREWERLSLWSLGPFRCLRETLKGAKLNRPTRT